LNSTALLISSGDFFFFPSNKEVFVPALCLGCALDISWKPDSLTSLEVCEHKDVSRLQRGLNQAFCRRCRGAMWSGRSPGYGWQGIFNPSCLWRGAGGLLLRGFAAAGTARGSRGCCGHRPLVSLGSSWRKSE